MVLLGHSWERWKKTQPEDPPILHLWHHLFLFLCLGFLTLILSPFAGELVASVTLGVSFYSFHEKMRRRWPRGSPSFHAFLSTFLVVFLIFLPLFLLGVAVINQSDQWLPTVRDWQAAVLRWKEGRLSNADVVVSGFRGWLSKNFALRPLQFREHLMAAVNNGLEFLMLAATRVPGALARMLTKTALVIFFLFFVFRDGAKAISRTIRFVPLPEHFQKELLKRAEGALSGVFRGWVLGAVIQGLCALVGYLLAGVSGWLILGALTIIAGLIPLVGTALVWVPVSLALFTKGLLWQGLFLMVWGIVVVGSMDNILRPLLAGRRLKTSFLVLFLSMVGGVSLWGLKGVILGPVLMVTAPLFLEFYRKRYLIGGLSSPVTSGAEITSHD